MTGAFQIPSKAFILAAGLGTRLRPYTDHTPKPLVEVTGKSLLSRILDHLETAGTTEAVINSHYLAEQITDHLRERKTPKTVISHETEILDTGLGIKRALGHFGDEAFYIINGDALWSDGPAESALARLAKTWNPEIMDILLLLQPVNTMTLTQGVGDYDIESGGRARRAKNKDGTYMFTGVRLNHPRIFQNTPETPFSYLTLMDRAQAQGRLHALVHDGSWHHISTPLDLDNVNEAFRKNTVDK